jgi:hypothetical protein
MRVQVMPRTGRRRRGPRGEGRPDSREGLVERVRALAPDGVDAALDVAGSCVLPELIELAGGPEHVVTIADFAARRSTG